MKKIILSVFGMLVMAAGLQAQELIKDNEFDNADLTTEYGSKDNVTFGTWCAVNDETAASFRIINDKQRGKVLEFSVDPKLTTWYKSFVAQRYEGSVEPGMYKLGFWAKSEDMGQVKVFIRLRDANGKDLQRFLCAHKASLRKRIANSTVVSARRTLRVSGPTTRSTSTSVKWPTASTSSA